VLVLDLAAPSHVFGDCGAPHYRFTVASIRPGPVRTSTGFSIVAERGLGALRHADTVVVPGTEDSGVADEPVLRELRRAAARGARIVSVCTGAFTLGYAGLLD